MKSLFLNHPKGRGVFAALTLVFFGSLGVDQVTKQHAEQSLLILEHPTDTDHFQINEIPVIHIGGIKYDPAVNYFAMNLHYTRNKGAAFSMFSKLEDKIRIPLFNFINILATVLIFLYLRSTPLHHYFTRFGLVTILSGATGNFVDRLHRGYVVDFFATEWRIFGWQHHFAIFNVADIAINIGVACLLIDMIVHRKDGKASA